MPCTGTAVALEAGQTLWSMFLFGFTMMFVVTGMYGVVRLKALRIGFTALYAVMAVLVYSGALGTGKSIADIHQIFWIPVILYGLVFVLLGLYALGVKLYERLKLKSPPPAQ